MAEVKHEGWKADCGFHRHDPKMTCSVRITSGVIHPKTESEARLIAAAPDLFEAAAEFCRRVEAGEIRSKRSYAAFKAALSKATAQQEGR